MSFKSSFKITHCHIFWFIVPYITTYSLKKSRKLKLGQQKPSKFCHSHLARLHHVYRHYSYPLTYLQPYCTGMHVQFVHCEILDVKHWTITQRCNYTILNTILTGILTCIVLILFILKVPI